jgi:uncharacterized membrane protein
LAVFLCGAACTQQPAPESCPTAPVDPPCPDAIPSFERDVYPNVFAAVCVGCHNPTGEEPSMPLTTYQQIHSRAGAIYSQVFLSCLMPPPNAPEPLSDGQRQKLLDWFGCGALDTP